jgi:drug/metabolite transporter (DMT)-like permease
MEKKNLAIMAMFLVTLLTSSAQMLYKLGVATLSFNVISVITNWQIIFGLMLYAIGAAIMIKSLKYGDVSMLYPIIATSYIWVSIGSSVFFDETMNFWKWFGVFIIMIGVSIISYGSKKEEAIVYTEGI